MSKILITGGTGFLGKNLLQSFKPYKNDHELFFVGSHNGDLTKPHDVSRLIGQFKPDVILHCAAKAGGILANTNSPATFISDNLAMSVNVYKEAAINKVKKVYALGSCCSYSHTPTIIPTPESALWEGGLPEISNAPYGIAKRALGMMSYAYRKQYDIGGFFAIPSNLYGEYDHFNLTNSHVVPALIRRIYTAKIQNKKSITCWGSGKNSRDLLFAGDLADTLVQLIINDFDYPEPINLGSGVEITIKELANKIALLVGFEGDVLFEKTEVSAIDGQPRRLLDNNLAKKLFNYAPKTSLDEGLKKTLDWYIEHVYPNQD